MPRGRFQAERYGQNNDAQATLGTLPVVSTTAVSLSPGRPTSDYVNQKVTSLLHLFGVRYEFTKLPVRIYDDTGNGGYGTLKIADLPTGYFKLLSAKSNLSRISANNSATAGTGIAADFDGDYSFGSAALGAAYATLTSTKGDFIPSTATAQAASSVSAGGIGRFNLATAAGTSLLDNSGGTAAATITTIVTGATVTPNTQNAIASLAKELNDLIGETSPTYEIDGSSSAVDVILNLLVDDADQDAGSDNAIAGDLLVSGWLEMVYFLT